MSDDWIECPEPYQIPEPQPPYDEYEWLELHQPPEPQPLYECPEPYQTPEPQPPYDEYEWLEPYQSPEPQPPCKCQMPMVNPVATIIFPPTDAKFKQGVPVIVKGNVSGIKCGTVKIYIDVEDVNHLKGETSINSDGTFKFGLWNTSGTSRGPHTIIAVPYCPNGTRGTPGTKQIIIFRMIRPLANYTVTGEFGDPRPGGRRHQGIDLAAPAGTNIAVAEDGTVRERYMSTRGGYTVVIDHGVVYVGLNNPDTTDYYCPRVVTRYLHCIDNSCPFEEGTRVNQGDRIANVDCTGRSTSCNHLHFEVREDEVAVNPRSYVSF